MNILDFANPINFWWGLIAIPIIALYILKVRLRRVPASTLLFWNQLYDEKKPRSWWQRLRHWLSLLLQLLVLAMIVVALVDPLWSWQKDQQRRVVLVLDNSASMQAQNEDGSTRLDSAKQSAIALIRSLRDGDQMALVGAGGRPQVVWGMTNHQRWLVDAIEAIEATDAPAALKDSVTLAERLLSGLDGESETIVLTDGCSPGLEDFEDLPSLTVYGVGEEQVNLAITRYQVRRSLIDAIGYQVLVDVRNFSSEPQECRLELELDGELVDVLPLKFEPEETLTRIVDHTSVAGGTMVAKLDREDALLVDNTARAILPTRKAIPVTLVGEGNLFVASVLSSIPLVDLTVVPEFRADQHDGGILVFDKQVPDELPAGPVLVVDPQEDCSLWTIQGEIDQPIVATVDSDSALTQHVRLDNVLFPGAKRLEFTQETQPRVKKLIRDPLESPLLSQIRRASGDAVVLTCSLEKGDLPLRIAFPVLMKNTIEWFQGESGQLRPASGTGEMVTLQVAAALPASSSKEPAADTGFEPDAEPLDGTVAVIESNSEAADLEYELVAPDGSLIPVATGDGSATLGPLLQAGIWTLRPTDSTLAKESRPAEGSSAADQANVQAAGSELEDPEAQAIENEAANAVLVACNLTSVEESDLRSNLDLPQAEELDMMLLGGRSIWFYLTLLTAGLITLEWWLYQRRIVG